MYLQTMTGAVAPRRQERKRSNWIERQMEKTKNKAANKKRLKDKTRQRESSSGGGEKRRREREGIKESERREDGDDKPADDVCSVTARYLPYIPVAGAVANGNCQFYHRHCEGRLLYVS